MVLVSDSSIAMELDSRRLLVAVAALSLVAVCAFGQATQIIVMMNNNENAITATCVEIISLRRTLSQIRVGICSWS